ncbi:hypothetical protein CCAN11_130001 [Capnocytophaga canimorsus]|uniref:Uncharacterized protein n=1 Tax=Capnocytophaga canimorsus TaxID=28188 RepID=A0A0B7I5Z0_9FLAO|nr:hypothetical protein CCAN11_130001 [Capnocytophaga canimorsus]
MPNNAYGMFGRSSKEIRIGNKLYFGKDESLVAEVIDNTTSRGRTLRFYMMVRTKNFAINLLS